MGRPSLTKLLAQIRRAPARSAGLKQLGMFGGVSDLPLFAHRRAAAPTATKAPDALALIEKVRERGAPNAPPATRENFVRLLAAKVASGEVSTSQAIVMSYKHDHPEATLEQAAARCGIPLVVMRGAPVDVTEVPPPELPARPGSDKDARREAFQARRERRVERLENAATRKRSEASARLGTAHAIGDRIPMGQPILVGHHSERRHRRDIDRIDNNMRKGFEAQDEAKAYERSARIAATNRDVSSDDPDAVDKLRAKLAKLEVAHAKLVAINKLVNPIKKHLEFSYSGTTVRDQKRNAPLPGGEAAIAAVRAKLEAMHPSYVEFLKPDFANRAGVPDYKLKNSTAEMARLRKRIAELEAKEAAPAKVPVQVGEVRIVEEENRVRIFFPGKPDEPTRAKLKEAGFKFAPTAGNAWQRMASPHAWYAAKEIVGAYRSSAPDAIEAARIYEAATEGLRRRKPKARSRSR